MRLIDADAFKKYCKEGYEACASMFKDPTAALQITNSLCKDIDEQPTVQQWHWTPVSRALPNKLTPVLITYVNRKPAPYYQDIKDKPDVAAAYYYNKKWWWFSSVCADYLSEYGQSPLDEIDAGIEVIAWMELPEPYKEEQ